MWALFSWRAVGVLFLAALTAFVGQAPAVDQVGVSGLCAQEPDGATVPELEELSIRFRARAYFLAKSAVRDRQAPGGFWESDNSPCRLREELPKGEIHLIARPEVAVAFDGRYSGFRVILANTGRKTLRLAASDSRLPIVREALDEAGRWRPIEYLPRSWCGNSYHRVVLPRNHYWSFDVPRYSGSEPTLMRFALEIEGTDRPIYSNEFVGRVNREQFVLKQGHSPAGIMDPYVD